MLKKAVRLQESKGGKNLAYKKLTHTTFECKPFRLG